MPNETIVNIHQTNATKVLRTRAAPSNLFEPNHLQRAVRTGSEPDRPELLYAYLRICDEAVPDLPQSLQLLRYEAVCDVLLEAICDDLVPHHWRVTCLDNLPKPLLALRSLASSRKAKRRVDRYLAATRTLSHYFLGASNHPINLVNPTET